MMSSAYFGLGGDRISLYARGFSNQRKVIGALLMRELHTRYGRENVGYLWLILEPMMLAGAVPAVATILIGAKLARDHSRRTRDADLERQLSLV